MGRRAPAGVGLVASGESVKVRWKVDETDESMACLPKSTFILLRLLICILPRCTRSLAVFWK